MSETVTGERPRTNRVSARFFPFFVSAILWGTVAALAGTQQWAQLRGTAKELAWIQAFAWQGASWLVLVPATPVLFSIVRKYPVDGAHRSRVLWHLVSCAAFGMLFVLASVPIRQAFHPSPVRWSMFGDAFYKSVPLGVLLGAVVYWAVVVVASLIETRTRLYALLIVPAGEEPANSNVAARAATNDLPNDDRASPEHGENSHSARATSASRDRHVLLETHGGVARLEIDEVLWGEPAPSGSRLKTINGSVLLRQSLADLESLLTPRGFVRVHRTYLVNSDHIREVIGSASRDGQVRLAGGATLPVSRRRRAALDSALSQSGFSMPAAPLAAEGAPLSG